jgi:hypothetical protein
MRGIMRALALETHPGFVGCCWGLCTDGRTGCLLDIYSRSDALVRGVGVAGLEHLRHLVGELDRRVCLEQLR